MKYQTAKFVEKQVDQILFKITCPKAEIFRKIKSNLSYLNFMLSHKYSMGIFFEDLFDGILCVLKNEKILIRLMKYPIQDLIAEEESRKKPKPRNSSMKRKDKSLSESISSIFTLSSSLKKEKFPTNGIILEIETNFNKIDDSQSIYSNFCTFLDKCKNKLNLRLQKNTPKMIEIQFKDYKSLSLCFSWLEKSILNILKE